jgi:hypothetical protein
VALGYPQARWSVASRGIEPVTRLCPVPIPLKMPPHEDATSPGSPFRLLFAAKEFGARNHDSGGFPIIGVGHEPLRYVFVGVMFVVTACGTMIPGSIYSTEGKVMPFEIEKSYGSGAVKAVDPDTGEQFTGTYVGIKEAVVATSSATVTGSASVVSGFGTTAITANMANANAYLKGDKGTMLTCVLQIQPGISPHGLGGCDDNHNRKYKLQF